jgi:hypothetical protein
MCFCEVNNECISVRIQVVAVSFASTEPNEPKIEVSSHGTLLVTHGKTSAARRVLPMTPRVRKTLETRWEGAGKPSEASHSRKEENGSVP